MFVQVARVVAVVFCLCLLFSPVAFNQGIGGSISGGVMDPNGPAVGAEVTIRNIATNQARVVGTDKDGHYEARELPPGRYNIFVVQSGFKIHQIKDVQLTVGQNARLQNITLEALPLELGPDEKDRRIEVPSEVTPLETTSPTLSTSFSERQIRELPILSRDLNNLALLAPGVFSVRAFSFASTLVPFAANGSRGRDNNFIIDSVDNNEPLFGGAAAQFTNTDLFAEYRILTNQYKAEYGRNSGSVVNIITERGSNQWRGTAFWYGQHDFFNATSSVERFAQVAEPVRFYENQVGATLGGPIKKEKAWVFASWQWDRARHDLSPLFPLVATLPTTSGLQALQTVANDTSFNPAPGFGCDELVKIGCPGPPVNALLALPTVGTLAGLTTPCGQPASGLPATNPCTIGSVFSPSFGVNVDYGTFLVPRGGVFDVRDHQGSLRYDQQLGVKDNLFVRYLFDDLVTPRTVGGQPSEVAFLDQGLMPESRLTFQQRAQNIGIFWTHAWPDKLHELRLSGTRISSQTGAFGTPEAAREAQPALTVIDFFANGVAPGGTAQGTASFLAAFGAAGNTFSVGRSSRPIRINSNVIQVQDNMSISSISGHTIKFGANFVRTQSNIRAMPDDLGQYFYPTDPLIPGFTGLDNFFFNFPIFGLQRFTNFLGTGGDVLPLREFASFFFVQDDIQIRPNFVLNIGMRYENYGQVINTIAERNPSFGERVNTDSYNFAPRIGFAWSPDSNWVVRGGYGFSYNPTVFAIPLLSWQSGPVSPFISGCPGNFTLFPLFNQCSFISNQLFPAHVFPDSPFSSTDLLIPTDECIDDGVVDTTTTNFVNCTQQDDVARNLVNPYVQNYSLSIQRQFGRDWLLEVSWVGSKGTKLFQRVDRNPRAGWSLATVTTPAPMTGCPAGTVASGTNCIGLSSIDLRDRQFVDGTPGGNLRGAVTQVTNHGFSSYQALQVSGTKRLNSRYGMAITAAYTWSHMLDNTSEIFGPGVVRVLNIFSFSGIQSIEAISPYAQNPRNTSRGERGNSSFDRRHRLAVSYIASLPSPDQGLARHVFGNWQVNGFVTAQSGSPFSPINGFSGNCPDALGDGVLTNDRPDVGNPNAPENSVALLNNRFCIDPRDPNPTLRALAAANRVIPGGGDYVTPDGQPTSTTTARFVQVGNNFVGNVGRNILSGPSYVSVDLALLKNFPWGERRNIQFRAEAYNLLNHANPGSPIGNVFSTDAQPVPSVAFAAVGPDLNSPARILGTIPENAIDATDASTGDSLFLSRKFMNTSSRKFQFALKLQF